MRAVTTRRGTGDGGAGSLAPAVPHEVEDPKGSGAVRRSADITVVHESARGRHRLRQGKIKLEPLGRALETSG